MKPSYALLILSTLAFTLCMSAAAKAAEELGLSFDLEPIEDPDPTSQPLAAIAPSTKTVVRGTEPSDDEPLPVPTTAADPPIAGSQPQPSGVYGGGQALALSKRMTRQKALLPPPPATSEPIPQHSQPDWPTSSAVATAPKSTPIEPIDELLGFDVEAHLQSALEDSSLGNLSQESFDADGSITATVAQLFQGGTESLVAHAVGSAEGTRTPEGHKTPAYFGHVDPGNRAWNLGTFSYQHGAKTPEEADYRQLGRLQSQTIALKQKAQASGMELSLEELLNGIDLANQAPMAALDRGGYVDWLARSRQLGMAGEEAIIWARTRSFLDPDTQRWNAPGLGNNIHSISHDQSRRVDAIARTVSVRRPPLTSTSQTLPSETPAPGSNRESAEPEAEQEAIALLFEDSAPIQGALHESIPDTSHSEPTTSPLPPLSQSPSPVETQLPMETSTQPNRDRTTENMATAEPTTIATPSVLEVTQDRHAPDRQPDHRPPSKMSYSVQPSSDKSVQAKDPHNSQATPGWNTPFAEPKIHFPETQATNAISVSIEE